MNLRASAFFLVAALTGLLVAGCASTPRPAGPLPAPVFSALEIPGSSGGTWTNVSPITPAPQVLPTKGRVVRVSFTAPVGSSFSVSLQALDGTLTSLRENHGTAVPPDGYFQIVSVDANQNPPVYLMHVRAPASLADPANFDVLIVNHSLRTDVTDSAPLIINLRHRPVFTVTVVVQGDGHVTSNPDGIQCGTSPSGRPMTDCSHDFGPVLVTLAPGSNTDAKFIGWSGNCAPNVQVCTLTLIGLSPTNAVAMFGASTAPVPVSTCPAAPAIAGLKWIDLPSCATGVIDQHPGISLQCDAQGYFCCEPGSMNSSAPRCGGQGKIESAPDCRQHAPNGMLRQPGGCYETE